MFHAGVTQQIEQELNRGFEARRQGFEGRARVCARRAAGIAIRAWLEGRGIAPGSASAYDLLAKIVDDPAVSERARQAAASLLERVNEAFELGSGADLLEVARVLISELQKTSE